MSEQSAVPEQTVGEVGSRVRVGAEAATAIEVGFQQRAQLVSAECDKGPERLGGLGGLSAAAII